MQFISLQPMLETKSIKDTIFFYTAVLGFKVEGSFNEGDDIHIIYCKKITSCW